MSSISLVLDLSDTQAFSGPLQNTLWYLSWNGGHHNATWAFIVRYQLGIEAGSSGHGVLLAPFLWHHTWRSAVLVSTSSISQHRLVSLFLSYMFWIVPFAKPGKVVDRSGLETVQICIGVLFAGIVKSHACLSWIDFCWEKANLCIWPARKGKHCISECVCSWHLICCIMQFSNSFLLHVYI